MSDDAPKIIVDDDWKSRAQAEKQKLAEQSRAAKAEAAKPAAAPSGEAAAATRGRGQRLPDANFESLVSTMTTQALFAMGAIPDPQTGQRMAHLDLARHHIDMLAVLEEKTKGNLSKEETDMLATTLYELRNRYVQLTMSQRPTA